MIIRIRRPCDRAPVAVEVRGADCPALSCFRPDEHMIRSHGAGMSGTFARSSGEYRCATREARDCPAPPERAHSDAWRFDRRRRLWVPAAEV